ncbi:hypothetical protein GH733_014206, partial [Mirounga leonina]
MRWGTPGSEGPAWALLAGSAASPAPSHSPSPPLPARSSRVARFRCTPGRRARRASVLLAKSGRGFPAIVAPSPDPFSWQAQGDPDLSGNRFSGNVERGRRGSAIISTVREWCGCPGSGEHKVIIVGLDNAGKTTILYQFLMNEVVHTSPTIGSNVEELVLRKTHFLIWWFASQSETEGEFQHCYSPAALRDAYVLIFANKQVMNNSMTTVEISQFLTLSAIKDHPWHIHGCCALTRE